VQQMQLDVRGLHAFENMKFAQFSARLPIFLCVQKAICDDSSSV